MQDENLRLSDVKKEILFDKMEQTIEKQDSKLITVQKENETLRARVAELETECHDTVTQCQQHIDHIEDQNDVLEEQIAELKAKVLPEEEMLFYYGAKCDLILNEAYENGMVFLTGDYLKATNFPIPLIDKLKEKSDSISTTNFILTKTGNAYYKLIRR